MCEERVPLRSRIWVSAADGACATLGGLASSGALTYYFTRVRGLDTRLASIVWLLFGIWNAVNDPLFGYISDKTKSKLGRRIPYIRYGAPLYAISFIAFWLDLKITENNQTLMFIQLLVLLFIFDTLYTAIATAIYIMPYEMAISNKARSSIYLWKILFNILSMAVPLIVIPMIQPGPGEDVTVYKFILTCFGAIAGLIIFISSFYYKERFYREDVEHLSFVKSMVECFKNKSFVIYETISFTMIYVQTALMQGLPYYFEEFKPNSLLLYLSLGAGIVFGIILYVRKRDVWGVKKCMINMSLLFSIGCLVILILGRNSILPAIGFFMFGIGFSGGMYLIPIMNGDVIDMDEHGTGLRREGMYAGVNSFITKPAISIAQAVFLSIIAGFGYDQGLQKGLQGSAAKTGILFAWTLVPGILLFLCFIALRWYPLDGKEWDDIKNSLVNKQREDEKINLEGQGFKHIEK